MGGYGDWGRADAIRKSEIRLTAIPFGVKIKIYLSPEGRQETEDMRREK